MQFQILKVCLYSFSRKLTCIWQEGAVMDTLLVCSKVGDFNTCFPGPNVELSFCTASDHILTLHKETPSQYKISIFTKHEAHFLHQYIKCIKVFLERRKHHILYFLWQMPNLLTTQQTDVRGLLQEISLRHSPACRSHKQSLPSFEELIWKRTGKLIRIP